MLCCCFFLPSRDCHLSTGILHRKVENVLRSQTFLVLESYLAHFMRNQNGPMLSLWCCKCTLFPHFRLLPLRSFHDSDWQLFCVRKLNCLCLCVCVFVSVFFSSLFLCLLWKIHCDRENCSRSLFVCLNRRKIYALLTQIARHRKILSAKWNNNNKKIA